MSEPPAGEGEEAGDGAAPGSVARLPRGYLGPPGCDVMAPPRGRRPMGGESSSEPRPVPARPLGAACACVPRPPVCACACAGFSAVCDHGGRRWRCPSRLRVGPRPGHHVREGGAAGGRCPPRALDARGQRQPRHPSRRAPRRGGRARACTWGQRGPHGVFEPQRVSHLVTWQDGRCSSGFLASLPRPESHLSVATGFGCATIYWLERHSPEFLVPFGAAGTVQDYVVAMLCGLQRPLMSEHNAASWGYFNTERRSWNTRVLEESGFPTRLLPDVAEAGAIAGTTTHEWFGVPPGTKVGVALGDLQCSVFSCMSRSTDAVLNVSTSVQLAASMPPGFKPAEYPEPSDPVAYFPYFGRTYLGVAASLNGGNVLATFVTMLARWMADLGVDIAEGQIYSQMIRAALTQTDTQLSISPTLLGERHLPDALASVSSISPTALSLGHVSRALCRGVVRNVHAMLPSQRLQEWGVRRLVGSGSALARNEVLRQEVERAFPLPVSYGRDVDAAAGAALAMLRESAAGGS